MLSKTASVLSYNTSQYDLFVVTVSQQNLLPIDKVQNGSHELEAIALSCHCFSSHCYVVVFSFEALDLVRQLTPGDLLFHYWLLFASFAAD